MSDVVTGRVFTTQESTALRSDFPILSRLVRLAKPMVCSSSGATSHKPHQVLDTERAFYQQHNSAVHRGAHQLVAEATGPLNLVAYSCGYGADEIVITLMEQHANVNPCQKLARRSGATLRWVGAAQGFGPLGVGVPSGRSEGSTNAAAPQRFEAGVPVAAACDDLTCLGMSRVSAHEQALTEVLLVGLAKPSRIPLIGTVVDQDRSGVVSFIVDDVHPHDVGQNHEYAGVAA
jgi:selenocysteine lyase/cysteine desulfurase